MKKLMIISTILLTIVLAGCSENAVTCGEGTIADGNTCILDDGTNDDVTIALAVNMDVNFTVGETLPNVLSYFVVTGATADASMITDDLVINSSNVLTTAGTYTITITVDGVSKSVTVTVVEDSSGPITLSTSAVTSFNIGDTLPDFSTFFLIEGVVVDNSMIEHTIILDATNTMTTAGVYSVTITAGGTSKTISILISDPNTENPDFVTIGVAGIYVDPSLQTVFEIGDYMPNFLSYFFAYDGVNYVTITPDLVLHNLLLTPDVTMSQAGTYQVWVDLSINGVVYNKTIELTVNPPGGATVESIGNTGWEIVNPDFTDTDLFNSWMVPNGDVVITNTAGEVDVQINTIGMNFWDILFAQPGKVFEKGYTYEVTYRMKTDLSAGRDVMVFVEPTSGSAKILEEQVSLTTTYQDFTFTFETDSNTTTGMVGVFIGANLPGAHPGSVLFDSVVITRTGEPVADVHLKDLPNQDFIDADISGWITEGQVVLTHDVAGYLVAEVTGLTGNFYDDNIQFGGFTITSGKTYTVSYSIRTDIVDGRSVTFFVEDTNANYFKYFETTEVLTNEFQTFTYTFTPTADNDDTKIGIFLGAMDNAFVGNVIIDAIVVTETE